MAAFVLPATAQAATPAAGHVRVAIENGAATADFSHTPARSSFVILQEWQRERLHELKAANPRIKVLMYKNLSAIMRAENGNAGTGVTAQEAESHPEWYLLNTRGERFTFWGYDYLWAADVGNSAYQQRWADDVSARLKADDWDGVFVDDANATMRYHYDPAQVARYPSDDEYSAATGSALALIGPRLRGEGELVIPNFADWRNHRTTVGGWLRYVSGGMEEQFTKWGNDPSAGYLTDSDWEAQLDVLKQTQAAGKYQLLVSHSDAQDENAARYGWATTLLAASGGGASFALQPDYSNETWFPEYDYDLGEPLGPEVRLESGIRRRVFQRGVVLVNPTRDAVRAEFGGRYRGSGRSAASSGTLGPHSGLIMLGEHVPLPHPPAALLPAPAPLGSGTAPAPRATASSRHARTRVTVRVRCRSSRRCHRVVRIKLGRRTVGRRVVAVRARGSRRVVVRLSANGRTALAEGRRLRTTVRAR
jgi:hypothetical protein